MEQEFFVFPTSFAQQRLWFLDQYEPNRSVYNIPSALRLKGSLDVAALERSLNEIVRRHESLRTTFTTADGEPVQVIAPSLNLTLSVVDLRETAESEREGKVNEQARWFFDLSRGPLFRASLICLREDDHILILTMHHIVSDGWSMGVLYRELSVLYAAFSQGKPSPLVDLPIQYADFAVWQRDWLQGEVLERQLSYWKKQLKGIPAVLNLPTDHPRPAVQSYRGARQFVELSKELTEGLKALSRKEGVTLFMTLLAAFQTLLYRYTGQEDIVVGSPIANRNRFEIERLIGCFVNTLVLRTTFRGGPTFRELLNRVKETALQAYAHQDLPFEKLTEELQPARSLSHSPLFQVMFVFQNARNTALTIDGLEVCPMRIGVETAKFDLILTIHESLDGLTGSLQYNTDLLDDSTITRMIGHWQKLLEGVITDPDQSIVYLPILTEAEKRRLVIEWNDTRTDYPKDKCIHQLFEEQVEKSPDAIAVTFEDQQLTYRELNIRANQLAHYLKKQRVGPDVLVAVCIERSVEMIIGLLGILKAGGAYVPLDPNHPKDRLAFLLEDSGASIILTELKFVERFRREQARLVCLDDERENIRREQVVNLSASVTAGNLAYVLYTSGTTGVPKGTMIEHGSVVNYLSWFDQAEMANRQQVFPFITNLMFDACLKQLFGPFLRAASIRILSDETISQPSLLLDALATCSGLNCVPTLWNALLDTSNWKDSPSIDGLSVLLLGGEALNGSLIDRTSSALPDIKIWNLYGPTETTANAIVGKVTPGQPIILGRPIANTQIYLLDSELQPVPVGVAGEICIGGAGLARGYLNRPELTAEKFIPNPFSDERGVRLYKTGDLARYRPDGNIEFLGRIDHQVKIRGFRIEVEEIEAVLGAHPSVRETIVVALEDSSGDASTLQRTDKRLVAYVVPDKEPTCTISELREFLKQKLPQYMIPSAFVFLDALPQTPNGKVDRKALPAVDQIRVNLDQRFSPPRTPVEEVLAAIWATLLGHDRIDVFDNFFDLGGHSLLATQLISRLRHALRVELPLRALFERPTVAGLAERIEETLRNGDDLQSLPMLEVAREGNLPLSFAQQRLWFLDQYEPNNCVYNIPSALRLRGCLNIEALERCLNEIVRRHESLRTTFSIVEGEPVQLIGPSLRSSLTVVELKGRSEGKNEEEIRRLVQEQCRQPFDLARGPLFRTTLIHLGEEDHILVLSMHHIVSDGWSMRVFYRELSVLYEAFTQSKLSPLADLSIQYADFAVWQREWLRGEVLERQLSYWKKQLEGIPAVLNLPTDHPRSAVQSYRGARQSIELSKELTEGLKALSRKEGVTLFMTLLAAFQTLLYRYTGQEDIVVGSPIANRNRAEIEGLIGFFVNTLVLRSNFSGSPTFRELLTKVREMALGAYAHQDLPFEKLVEEMHPERCVDSTPLFQVLFNMVNRENQKFELLGLTAERISSSQAESKFDLTLYVREEEKQIRLDLVYRAALFSQARMTCFAGQYRYLLEQIVGEPEKLIGSYSLVTPESRPLLPDPAAALASPVQELVTSRIGSWGQQTPSSAAICQGQQIWTYAELAQCADVLARRIVASGLAPKEVVAVQGQPSFGLITAMIAAFLAGGVLLPLDPSLPTQRKHRMLREAKAKRLLYVGAMQPDDSSLEETFASRVLFIDSQKGSAIETEAEKNLQPNGLPQVHPDDPAYVFFTSGSTGVPKGVLGCHKGLSHFLTWQREEFAIGPGDRVAQLTALSFDAVLRDIFLPLTSGATLCLPDSDDSRGSGETIAWLDRQQITVLHAVPSLAQSWLASRSATHRLSCMRWAFFMGEPLTETFVHLWRSITGNTGQIVNFYGPTETTLIKCFYRVPDQTNFGVQPVGQPLPNTQALVLSRNNQLCGINEPGQIVLRTPFRALGYINAPEENQKRFIKNPFCDDPEDLVYLTGDEGCYGPDGLLKILGRCDDQIKIRGVRIEPSEVTALLASHPLVHSCVVLGRKNDQNEFYLAAYLVAVGEQKPSSAQLRAYLLDQLPPAMVPSVFVHLDVLPLSPNGKIDRQALPDPGQIKSTSEQRYVPPRTDIERIVASVWKGVLKKETIGVDDNFFDLGGHSLLATQIVSRLREAFRMELSLRSLFERPTVAALSDHIKMARQKRGELKAMDPLIEIEEITL
jgi:amino acid adenylation domain-containing protein